MNDFNSQRVYVMGLGRFGGGVGVTRYLVDQGASVVVGDSGDPAQLSGAIGSVQDQIDSGRVGLALGAHASEDLDGVDTLVVNPAVPMPWDHPFVSDALSRGIRITTEIEIAYRLLNPERVIAVTGSAGKSTTSAMVHHALCELGSDAVLGGNIGGSLLNDPGAVSRAEYVVLELSSAMLYWLDASGVLDEMAPRVGCVTNCLPNHLDWHGDAAHYERCKQSLVACLHSGCTAVLGDQVRGWGKGSRAEVRVVHDADRVQGCAVPGRHNAVNAAMAVWAIDAVLRGSASADKIRDAVRSFSGLPHRIQLVHEAGGIRFYNDSKCTVPGATVLAVEAITELVDRSRIHLIAGGYDKGSDLSAISAMAPDLAGLYTIGKTGVGIATSSISNAEYCGDLDSAMHLISQRIDDGEVVLLSPGCASWDQFSNYEQRGERFAQLASAMRRERV